MALRLCSECGASLRDRGPQAMTCGDTCRAKRSRRLRMLNEDEQLRALGSSNHDQEIQSVTREVMKEELRPVVREALTEEALRGIRTMLELTPRAVQVLLNDMDGEDPVLAQRAAQTVIKYTMGHPALVRADDADGSKQIVVNFALPRPGVPVGEVGGPPNDEGAVDGEGEELRTCDTCGLEKGASQFEETSTRCADCHEELRRKVLERIGAG